MTHFAVLMDFGTSDDDNDKSLVSLNISHYSLHQSIALCQSLNLENNFQDQDFHFNLPCAPLMQSVSDLAINSSLRSCFF